MLHPEPLLDADGLELPGVTLLASSRRALVLS
jgi:hypothetical protein